MHVAKHGSVQIYPTPFYHTLGVNVPIFKFRNNYFFKAIVNIFAEILHAGRAAIDMKHIKGDFSLNTWVRSPRVNIGGGTEAKINLFSEYGHVAYQIKAEEDGNNMVVNLLPTDKSLTLGWGQKVEPYLFSESSHIAYQIKGN